MNFLDKQQQDLFEARKQYTENKPKQFDIFIKYSGPLILFIISINIIFIIYCLANGLF